MNPGLEKRVGSGLFGKLGSWIRPGNLVDIYKMNGSLRPSGTISLLYSPNLLQRLGRIRPTNTDMDERGSPPSTSRGRKRRRENVEDSTETDNDDSPGTNPLESLGLFLLSSKASIDSSSVVYLEGFIGCWVEFAEDRLNFSDTLVALRIMRAQFPHNDKVSSLICDSCYCRACWFDGVGCGNLGGSCVDNVGCSAALRFEVADL